MEKIIIFIFLIFFFHGNTQDLSSSIDSLQKEINKYPDYDTLKIKNILILANVIGTTDKDKELELYKEAYRQAEKIKHPKLFTESAHSIGVSYFYLGDYQESEKYFEVAVEVARKNRLPELMTYLKDLGQTEDMLGKEKAAITHTIEATEIAEDIKDFGIMVSAYNNLASFYYYKDQNEKALEYYEKARDILVTKLDLDIHHNTLSITESNIGWCHYYMGNLDKAIDQLKKAVEIHREYENVSSSSCKTRNSLAQLYLEKGKFELASLYVNEALSIAHDLQFKEGKAACYMTIADIKFKIKNYGAAIDYYNKSLETYKELGYLYEMSINAEKIAKCYSAIGKHQSAFEFMETSKYYSDSLIKIESQAAFEDAITRYETEKKEAENELLLEQAKLKDVQLEKQRSEAKAREEKQLIIGVGIAILLLGVIFFFINRNRLKTRKNKELAMQRDEIAEQKKEITDSINYARRIQNSFLPSRKDFAIRFEDHFLMYEPKDIVAGDFYILEETNDSIHFAVADCTGHGVPGAMVSIVCSAALRKAIHEDELKDPAAILGRTRDLVIHQFARKGHVVKDGMDITFCRLDKKNNRLFWSGANNPLWIIRKGEEVLEEIKPDKQPIGRYLTNAPFTSHEVHLGKGDQIYLITDGYPDQFGGPKGKKFKYKQLKQMLIDLKEKPMSQQLETLSHEFFEWKGDLEQVDDVCILGIRF